MKKLVVLGMGLCVALAFSSCKSSESAYKKAYEKAKQQELAEPQTAEPVEVAPTVTAPVEARVVESTPVATAGVCPRDNCSCCRSGSRRESRTGFR